ncbi:hypothetical protein HC891_24380 [Candidatus Gracilibacteria bacterium]|nr:hypothetical protein [Candidatus Gracilibacteria bacterium]
MPRGAVIEVGPDSHAELLWGLRGGGGNFGVVTRFDFQLHPVGPEVMFAFVFHDGSDGRMADAIRFYRDFACAAPDEVSTLLACGVIPPDPAMYPATLHGRPFAAFVGLYVGDPEEGRRLLQPLRDFSTPLIDASDVMPYIAAQQAFEHEFPAGRRYYWKSLNVSQLHDAAITQIAAHALAPALALQHHRPLAHRRGGAPRQRRDERLLRARVRLPDQRGGQLGRSGGGPC